MLDRRKDGWMLGEGRGSSSTGHGLNCCSRCTSTRSIRQTSSQNQCLVDLFVPSDGILGLSMYKMRVTSTSANLGYEEEVIIVSIAQVTEVQLSSWQAAEDVGLSLKK